VFSNANTFGAGVGGEGGIGADDLQHLGKEKIRNILKFDGSLRMPAQQRSRTPVDV
jgi:hypothetical protein